MNAKRLKKHQRRLYSRIPLIAERQWRQAAQALVEDGSPTAVQILAEAVTRHNDAQAQQVMVEALRRLEDQHYIDAVLTWLTTSSQSATRPLVRQRCIDAVCAVWAATRHTRLAALLTERGWVASAPAEVKVLSTLLVGQLEGVTAGGKDVVAPLVQACEDADPTLAARAQQALHNLQHSEAQEILCRIVLDSDQPTAREVAITAQYAPQDPPQRALFYFLTEQWDKYETLDFDQTLLRAMYEVGDARLRQRVAATARRAGRVEWIEVATGGRPRRRLGEMTYGEWEATLALLSTQKHGEALWRLAQVAPAVWSVRLLHQLADMAWMPQAEQEREGFVEIGRLAAMLAGKTPELPRFAYSLSTLGKRTHKSPPYAVTHLAMSPDGQVLASSRMFESRVWLWCVPDGSALCTLEGHKSGVEGLTMSPTEQVLASGGSEGTVQLWRVPDGHVLCILSGHTGRVICLAMSPDGRVLASGSADRTVRLWRVPDGQALCILSGHTGQVTCLAMSPDGRVLASGSADRTVRLWSLPDGSALRTLSGHTGGYEGVSCLAISPDGRVLASGGADRTVRLWSLPDGEALCTLSGHQSGVRCLAISPDGRVLASGSADETVQLWSLAPLRLISLPLGHLSGEDMAWVQQTLASGKVSEAERGWLAFLLAMMRWRRRFDIGVGEVPQWMEVGEFDIEIEG